MPLLIAFLIGIIAFLLQVGIAAVIIMLVVWLLGLNVSASGAVGIGIAVIVFKNLLASAVK